MKISKDKRNKLILVALGVGVCIFGLWYLLISNQMVTIREVQSKIQTAQDKELRMQQAVKVSNVIQTELNLANEKLKDAESGIASGDLYSWMYNTIKDFKTSQHVDIPQFSSVDAPTDCNLVSKFPYKQTRMAITGTGLFYDIGRFIADFENQFPYMRIENLELSPGGANSSDREKLAFRMNVVALVKSTDAK